MNMADDSWARKRFSEIVRRPQSVLDLGRAVLLIAAEEYPGIDIDAYIQRLDAIADSLRPRLRNATSDLERLQLLTHHLHVERELRGNVSDYYDPRNSFLNEVMDRGLGVPITLSVVYLEVARRLQIPLSGVSFPGHFLLRHDGYPSAYLDPFAPSTLLGRDDCERLLAQISEGRGEFDESYLAPANSHDILLRILCNLKVIYLRANEPDKALAAVNRILLLAPDEVNEYRDRAVLYMQLEAFRLAQADLEFYLPFCSDASEREMLRAALRRVREQVANLN